MDKILKNSILEYLIACHSPMFLKTRWNNQFKNHSITVDKLKDIFIMGALYGLILKMVADFYDTGSTIPNDVLIEVDTLVNDFMANRFE